MIRAVPDARFDLPQSEPRLRPRFETGARNLSLTPRQFAFRTIYGTTLKS